MILERKDLISALGQKLSPLPLWLGLKLLMQYWSPSQAKPRQAAGIPALRIWVMSKTHLNPADASGLTACWWVTRQVRTCPGNRDFQLRTPWQQCSSANFVLFESRAYPGQLESCRAAPGKHKAETLWQAHRRGCTSLWRGPRIANLSLSHVVPASPLLLTVPLNGSPATFQPFSRSPGLGTSSSSLRARSGHHLGLS